MIEIQKKCNFGLFKYDPPQEKSSTFFQRPKKAKNRGSKKFTPLKIRFLDDSRGVLIDNSLILHFYSNEVFDSNKSNFGQSINLLFHYSIFLISNRPTVITIPSYRLVPIQCLDRVSLAIGLFHNGDISSFWIVYTLF